MDKGYTVIDPEDQFHVLKGLASPVRVAILKLLHRNGPTNINAIAGELALPQSSVSMNVRILEEAGLLRTETRKARKGNQKLCHAVFDELIVNFKPGSEGDADPETIDVSMPIGLYSTCEITAPCGICSPDGIIGYLDVPATFLDPERMRAALLWFTCGFVEYQFPNNSKMIDTDLAGLEFSAEISSEVPGTDPDWPSDITLSINGTELGIWTSPGDFGDRRGRFTPHWWKLRGSQYGMLKRWTVDATGTFVDGVRISDVTLSDLALSAHRSIRVRLEVKRDARRPGGLNIFGRGFGNYDQDLLLRLRRA